MLLRQTIKLLFVIMPQLAQLFIVEPLEKRTRIWIRRQISGFAEDTGRAVNTC